MMSSPPPPSNKFSQFFFLGPTGITRDALRCVSGCPWGVFPWSRNVFPESRSFRGARKEFPGVFTVSFRRYTLRISGSSLQGPPRVPFTEFREKGNTRNGCPELATLGFSRARDRFSELRE